MLEFFKVLSGVTASIISIVFAFLLSKIISFEEKSSDIIEKIENRVIELNELKIDIKSMGMTQGEYDDSENEIFEKYFEIILDIDEESDENIVMYILKEKEIFFITVNEIMGKLEARKKEWCKESLKEIVNFIEKNYFSSISDVYKNIEEKFKSTKLIKKFLPEKYNLFIENAFRNSKKNKNSFFLHNNNFNYSENLNLIRNYQSYRKDKIKAMIDKYEIKISSLENEEKKLNYLEREKSIYKKSLILLYFLFIVGVIYPLSFIKFEKETFIDFSIYRNFLEQLFTLSGIFLTFLSLIVGISLYFLWNILSKANYQIKEIRLDNDDWILKSYFEYKKL